MIIVLSDGIVSSESEKWDRIKIGRIRAPKICTWFPGKIDQFDHAFVLQMAPARAPNSFAPQSAF
jgi:hypothetical protein